MLSAFPLTFHEDSAHHRHPFLTVFLETVREILPTNRSLVGMDQTKTVLHSAIQVLQTHLDMLSGKPDSHGLKSLQTLQPKLLPLFVQCLQTLQTVQSSSSYSLEGSVELVADFQTRTDGVEELSCGGILHRIGIGGTGFWMLGDLEDGVGEHGVGGADALCGDLGHDEVEGIEGVGTGSAGELDEGATSRSI